MGRRQQPDVVVRPWADAPRRRAAKYFKSRWSYAHNRHNGARHSVRADGGKTWQPTGVFLQARRIVIEGLTPGTTYTFRFRALGGSTGHGDWSDPVSHMAR